MAVAVRVGPATDARSDHELVAAVRRGDDGAFATLFDRYQRRITAFAFGMVGDWARAEDVTQDVFISALRRMRETERPIAFKPWIYEIAKNACIDQFRRSRRAEEISYDSEERMGASDIGRLADTGPVPEVAVEHKQQLDDLIGAFGGLSRSHHDILVLRELEGLTYHQIGERMGLSRPSVESTLFRARRRLGEEYDDLTTGRRCIRVRAIIAEAGDVPLGVRDRGRVSRHLAHCQPCRRHAVHVGVAPELFERPAARTRVAALLPIPMLFRRRATGGRSAGDAAQPASVHLPTTLANVAATTDPAALWSKAAAAGLTIMVAAGASVATRSILGQADAHHAASSRLSHAKPHRGSHARGETPRTPRRTESLANNARPARSGARSSRSRAHAGRLAPGRARDVPSRLVLPAGRSAIRGAAVAPDGSSIGVPSTGASPSFDDHGLPGAVTSRTGTGARTLVKGASTLGSATIGNARAARRILRLSSAQRHHRHATTGPDAQPQPDKASAQHSAA